MNTPFQFCHRLATGGAILAQQATFLPVAPLPFGQPTARGLPDRLQFRAFLPFFDPDRKYLTVAQALLEEILR